MRLGGRPAIGISSSSRGLSRRGIEIRVLAASDFEVVGQCANGREALAAITQHKPDVVFLDIQMPGLSGFDVLTQLPQESLPVVVFVTAYDQYAIRAFEAKQYRDAEKALETALTRPRIVSGVSSCTRSPRTYTLIMSPAPMGQAPWLNRGE